MKEFKKWLTILFILGALAVTGFFVEILESSETSRLVISNCVSGTWVGGVVWTDYEKTKDGIEYKEYAQLPEVELKVQDFVPYETAIFELTPGLYSFTHYRPRRIVERNGNKITIPARILDYRTIELLPGETKVLTFGCN